MEKYRHKLFRRGAGAAQTDPRGEAFRNLTGYTTERVTFLIILVKKGQHNLNFILLKALPNKGNNKITELRTILQRESKNS
jgi:hypothetical protein